MNRRSFLRGAAAVAVAVPLAPLIPEMFETPIGWYAESGDEWVRVGPATSAMYTDPSGAFARTVRLETVALQREIMRDMGLWSNAEINAAIARADRYMT